MSDILRALRNPHGWRIALLVAAVLMVGANLDALDAWRDRLRVQQQHARAAQAARAAHLAIQALEDYCAQKHGESLPVYDDEGQLLRCEPRRKS